jgi:hypothetical protein
VIHATPGSQLLRARLVAAEESLGRTRAALVASMAFAATGGLPEFWPSASTVLRRGPPVVAAEEARWCLLLTATTTVQVDLTKNGFGRGQQRSRAQRQRTYADTLSKWLGSGLQMPVVLAENSNDETFLTELHAQLHGTAPRDRGDQKVDLVEIGPATTCDDEEIGCHEASAILRAVRKSRFFRREAGRPPRCTHALKVTGRYFVHELPKAIQQCPRGTAIAVEHRNASFNDVGQRQETMVLGFDTLWTEALFGWSRARGMCQECHMTQVVKKLRELRTHARTQPPHARGAKRAKGVGGVPRTEFDWLRDALCDLPLMSVDPVREGSTGRLRTQVRS